MKRKLSVLIMSLLATVCFVAGCGTKDKTFNKDSEIILVSREDGSGTRGAFVDLFGLSKTLENGSKYDMTSLDAIISNSTSVVKLTIKGNPYAIGYISLGSLNDTVKPVEINGVSPTIENVKNDTYEITRPFLIATKGELSDSAQDFVNYILSEEGQSVVEKAGYVPIDGAKPYEGNGSTEKVSVAGSSSVSPLMEKLKEGYLILNPNAKIEIQQSDSTVGITSTEEGIVDVGMASRELKQSEIDKGVVSTVIAKDALAIIVNNENPIDNLTTEQVGNIFGGNTTTWSQVIE